MKTKELRSIINKSKAELEKTLSDKRTDLDKVRLDMSAGKEKNLKRLKSLRHEIAQLLTLLNQKKLVEAEKSKENV